MTNSADPDKTAWCHLDLHCLQRYLFWSASQQGIEWLFVMNTCKQMRLRQSESQRNSTYIHKYGTYTISCRWRCAKTSRRIRTRNWSAWVSTQSDQGFHCPLAEYPYTLEYINGLIGAVYVRFNWMHEVYFCQKLPTYSITKTCLYSFDPLKPHFYIVKLGLTGVYIIYFCSKHRLWVFVRTASTRRFLRIPTIYVLSRNMKNIRFFLSEIFHFWW